SMEQKKGSENPLSLSAAFDTAYSSALHTRTSFIFFSAITFAILGISEGNRVLFEQFVGTQQRIFAASLFGLAFFFWVWLLPGQFKVSLDATRGRPIRLSDFVLPPGLVFRCLVIGTVLLIPIVIGWFLLVVLGTVLLIPIVIGLFLLVVPGLYLAAMW